jgi:hypothetical protein
MVLKRKRRAGHNRQASQNHTLKLETSLTRPPAVVTIADAARFQMGLLWRIERCLDISKAELFSPNHDKAADATRDLTAWRSTVSQWSVYRAQAVMTQLNRRIPQLVAKAVAEAAEAERLLMAAMEVAA